MKHEQNNTITCAAFEDLLSEYLEKTLDTGTNRLVAAHALSCPVCHTLLNDVKESLAVCREIAAPAMPITRLEARILSATTPETSMACEDFESHLTDYLDGFLPAAAFHRWERHAALCESCEDLPGMVVRSIAACYTYKTDELAVPAGLHERILQATIGTAEAEKIRASWWAEATDWVRGLRFPVAVPQFAPIALILAVAFFMFSETVSADGSLTGVYQKGFQLAGQTYQQSAAAWKGGVDERAPATQHEPAVDTRFIGDEEQK